MKKTQYIIKIVKYTAQILNTNLTFTTSIPKNYDSQEKSTIFLT